MTRIVWNKEDGTQFEEYFKYNNEALKVVHILNMITDNKCNAHIPEDRAIPENLTEAFEEPFEEGFKESYKKNFGKTFGEDTE